MLYSRIDAAAAASGASLLRVDDPADLPSDEPFDLVLVDWSARRSDWADGLARWRDRTDSRVILFGRHTDLEAHASARAAGLGPMWARSKLVAELSTSVMSKGPRSTTAD
jgi:DNA-binding response OmpR family regulator